MYVIRKTVKDGAPLTSPDRSLDVYLGESNRIWYADITKARQVTEDEAAAIIPALDHEQPWDIHTTVDVIELT